jgi:predicted dehydrogenase
MVVYDDMEPSEKVKMYNRGVEIRGSDSMYKALVEYRMGDMFAPFVDQTEALALMAKDFVTAIKTGMKPKADGNAGLSVVRVLEAAERSMKMGGRLVDLSGNGITMPHGASQARIELSKVSTGG